MRDLVIFSIFVLGLNSCGGNADTNDDGNENGIEFAESENYPEGKEVYMKTCVACHQGNGEGLTGVFPPLAEADYLLEDIDRAIEQVLNGSNEEMLINGTTYNGIMPPQLLTDQEVADVMNFVLNSWGNDGGEITLDMVKNTKHPD